MNLWLSQIGLTWKWCSEYDELMSVPVKVSFHKGIYYVDKKNLKSQEKDIENFGNLLWNYYVIFLNNVNQP